MIAAVPSNSDSAPEGAGSAGPADEPSLPQRTSTPEREPKNSQDRPNRGPGSAVAASEVSACREDEGFVRRFWSKVNKQDGECWTWTAKRTHEGYGRIKYKGHDRGASRVSWIIANGEIPSGMVVCHRCDSPPCVNPSHLFLGTQKDNVEDAAAKGRMARGPRNAATKLTAEQVIEIRRSVASGESQASMARKYGVDAALINGIVKRTKWKWI